MTAADILKLIETVSPDDTVMLDEIDFEVAVYQMQVGGCRESVARMVTKQVGHLKYTRDRNALKFIRPKCYFRVGNDDKNPDTFKCEILPMKAYFASDDIVAHGPTEELAELHAIIQAIEYERKLK